MNLAKPIKSCNNLRTVLLLPQSHQRPRRGPGLRTRGVSIAVRTAGIPSSGGQRLVEQHGLSQPNALLGVLGMQLARSGLKRQQRQCRRLNPAACFWRPPPTPETGVPAAGWPKLELGAAQPPPGISLSGP